MLWSLNFYPEINIGAFPITSPSGKTLIFSLNTEKPPRVSAPMKYCDITYENGNHVCRKFGETSDLNGRKEFGVRDCYAVIYISLVARKILCKNFYLVVPGDGVSSPVINEFMASLPKKGL